MRPVQISFTLQLSIVSIQQLRHGILYRITVHIGLPYPGNLLPGYPPGNTTGTRVPDRKRK